jgi:sugar transferase (PEP-CTERM/EpsH1 system associated)
LKVVFLSQRVPYPPDRGDRITTCHFLRHLLERGAQVRLGCFAEDARDDEGVARLARDVAAVAAPRLRRKLARFTSLRGLVSGEALTLPFFRNTELQRTVQHWIASDAPDLIYVYSSSMAQYALDARGPVRLMQFAELDSDKWRQYAAERGRATRWVYEREARRLLEFERRVARSFDVSCVVSEVERELFRARIPDVDPVVLPNGVDVEHFVSAGDGAREPQTVIFTGVMDYAPNVDGVLWFVRHCWPAVRARFAAARLLIVGSRPLPACRALHGRDGIEVTGRVPQTPPWFDRATVAIAPLRLARGVQNKVLEAMSMGLPVVATPQAAQGLGAVARDVLRVASDAEATVEAIGGLLADPAAARTLGARAAAFVRSHYRWQDMYAILDRVLAAHGL